MLGNDNSGATSAAVTTPPNHGDLYFAGDGSFTYTPNLDFVGEDSFIYQSTNGTLNSNFITVTLNVEAANQAPVGVANGYTLDENGSLSVSASGVLGNDTDPDNDPLTASLISGPTHGMLSLSADGSFAYIPNADFDGTDSFTYKANDGEDDSGETTVTLTVVPTNHVPVAVAEGYSVDENSMLTVPTASGVLANDTDADNDPLTAVLVSPSYGTVALNADGSFTYTPVNGYSGYDSFVYKANDGTADSAEATVSITVNDVSAPVANPDAYSVDEDSWLWIAADGVLDNDQRQSQEATLVYGTTNGALTLNPDGSFWYTPYANFNGQDSFTYQLEYNVQATVYLTVNSVNDKPTAAGTSEWGYEDGQIFGWDGRLMNGSVDIDGPNALQAVLEDFPEHGIVSISPQGSFVYTPNLNFSGQDKFTFKLYDGLEYSDEAEVSLMVYPANDSPVAVDDTYSLVEDEQCFTADLLVNDSDPDGDPLYLSLPNVPGLSQLSGGFIQYIPPANYSGTFTFSYSVSDWQGGTASASVTFNIAEVNDAPVATNDSYAIDEDGILSSYYYGFSGVLANDNDPDTNMMPASAQLLQGPTNGVLSFDYYGSFTYTPNANFNGTDEFVYQAVDNLGTFSSPATVSITVNSANDLPIVHNESFTLAEDTTLSVNEYNQPIDLSQNDSDQADGQTLTYTPLDYPAHGTFTLTGSGNFTYTPAANYHGPDSFTYLANDGWTSVMGMVSLTVMPVNDGPVALDDTLPFPGEDIYEDVIYGSIASVLDNDDDIDGDTLTAFLVTSPAHGFINLATNGQFSYVSMENYNGPDSFTYKVSDGYLESTATVSLSVMPVNDAPMAVDDDFSITSGAELQVQSPGVLGNDDDFDSFLIATISLQPSHGTLTFEEDGSFSYVPAAGFIGTDSFQYSVTDGSMDDSAVVAITVSPRQAYVTISPESVATEPTAEEGVAYATFTITLVDGVEATNVGWGTTLESTDAATPGVDYASTNGVVMLSPQSPSQTIQIPIYHNEEDEEEESFAVAITSASGENTLVAEENKGQARILKLGRGRFVTSTTATGIEWEGDTTTITATLNSPDPLPGEVFEWQIRHILLRTRSGENVYSEWTAIPDAGPNLVITHKFDDPFIGQLRLKLTSRGTISNGIIDVKAKAAYPVDFAMESVATNQNVLGVFYTWSSSSGRMADLDGVDLGEFVWYTERGRNLGYSGTPIPFNWPRPFTSTTADPTVKLLPAEKVLAGRAPDAHRVGAPIAEGRIAQFTAKQFYWYEINDGFNYSDEGANGITALHSLGDPAGEIQLGDIKEITRRIFLDGSGAWKYRIDKSDAGSLEIIIGPFPFPTL